MNACMRILPTHLSLALTLHPSSSTHTPTFQCRGLTTNLAKDRMASMRTMWLQSAHEGSKSIAYTRMVISFLGLGFG